MADMTHSETLGKLGAALALAQACMEGAKKSSKNPFFKSDYADLASVLDACREPLTANNLSVVQLPVSDAEGRIGISTTLLHSSGEWISGAIYVKPRAETDPQVAGSILTYLRRYGLSAAAGVAQVDDDGHAGAHTAPAKKQAVKPTNGTATTEPSDPSNAITITYIAEKPYTSGGKSGIGYVFTLSDGREVRTVDAELANRAKPWATSQMAVDLTCEAKGGKLFVVEMTPAISETGL